MSSAPSAAADPFFLPGTRPTACLLIHGFTGTPAEMRPLGEHLAELGFTVLGVRLAGHGSSAADLARTRWTDWYASVEKGLERLLQQPRPVAVAGMSLGGLLAIHLAHERPAAVRALALCGTPLFLADRRARWLLPPLLALPLPGLRSILIAKEGGSDVADAEAREALPSYREMPLGGILELLRLRRRVRSELAAVRQPCLLVHGRHDHSVPLANLDLLARRLGSTRIERLVCERSYHVVTVDRDHETVAQRIGEFFASVERENMPR